MPRVKVARKSTAIDMTAMCDVAFLLLTFFILTAKPKIDDPSHASVPPSSYLTPVADANMITLSVGTDKVFFSVTEQDVRVEVLKEMGAKYGNQVFNDEEIKRFSVTPIFGVPMNNIKSFLDTPPEQVKNFPQAGIPVDTTENNELFIWILLSRKAEKGLHDKDLQVSIKADRSEVYPEVNKVIGVLEKQKIFKFDLITTLQTGKK